MRSFLLAYEQAKPKNTFESPGCQKTSCQVQLSHSLQKDLQGLTFPIAHLRL